MYGYIYKTTNILNGSIYIGKHEATVFEGTKYLGSGLILGRAINKYGKDNFRVELVEQCNSLEELNSREKYWIAYYKGLSIRMYNIAEGGDGGDLCRHYPEEKKKEINKKKAVPLEHNCFHLIPRVGELNGMYGKKHSETTISKIKETKKMNPYHFTDEQKQAKSKIAKSRGIRPPLITGKLWYNNGVKEIYVNPDDCSYYEKLGYTKGRLKMSDAKRSAAFGYREKLREYYWNYKNILGFTSYIEFQKLIKGYKSVDDILSILDDVVHSRSKSNEN